MAQAETQRTTPLLTPLLDELRNRAAGIRDETLVLIPAAFVLGAISVSLLFWAMGSLESPRIADASPGLLSFFGWVDGVMQNFGTEMIGAVVTIVLLEVMLDRRRRDEADDREKKRLILQMGSPFNESAVEAARQLEHRGWLEDGSLKGADLSAAQLEGADLFKAHLEGAFLSHAHLEGASLRWAQLEGAVLFKAHLEGADLIAAHLEGASLRYAHLEGAKNVTVAMLREAETLEGATLPDGTTLPGREGMALLLDEGEEPDWRTPFEAWCETVETDEFGNIIPAKLDDEDEE